MKFIILAAFVFFFVYLPMYMLNALVMPGLDSLQNTYANADQTATQIVSASR